MRKISVLSVQMPVSGHKKQDLDYVKNILREKQSLSPDFVLLPEMFCCPYETPKFPLYAEKEGEETWQFLSSLAREHHIYLIAGSVPEKDDKEHIYNTCYIFDREGRQIGKHRKAHLFDIDVKGGQYFKESDTLTPGDHATVFDTEFGKMGAAICYDIRFPEFFRTMVLEGAQIVFLPGAFNMTTGPAHWELSVRMRALDNQIYVAACEPARDEKSSYVAWGHTMTADPWGQVIGSLDEKEGTLLSEVDLDRISSIREQLPLLKHRRPELYQM